jgi:hypothetical protein
MDKIFNFLRLPDGQDKTLLGCPVRPEGQIRKQRFYKMNMPPDMKPVNTSEAHAMKLSAEKIRQSVADRKGWSPDRKEAALEMADDLEVAANRYLTLNPVPARGVGGEFIQETGGKSSLACPPREKIDRVSTDASLGRLDLVEKNGVLSMALDTAEAVNAKTAAEQMLAHQMAVAHRTSFDLIADAAHIRDPVEKCRLINTATKLMDTCQKAFLTIHRVRHGGQQTVTVQHVQVEEGGQAVVNGTAHIRGRLTEK